MDILAARKKAAEKTRARLEQEAARVPVEPRPVATPPEPVPPAPAPETPASGAEQAPPAAEPASSAPADSRPSVDDDVAERAAQEIEILTFRLGHEEYAVMVADVREVLKVRELTRVPNAPDYVLGVASLRGAMLPVIDLCKRLGITPGVRDEKSRIVVVSPDDEDVGLVVDRVAGVVRIPPDAVKPAPETIEHGEEYLRGIVRKGDRLYIILDLAKAVGT